MNLFEIDDRTKLLTLLKENAPSIHGPYVAKKISILNSKLNQLRNDYKSTKDEEEKRSINREANHIKEEIVFYSI